MDWSGYGWYDNELRWFDFKRDGDYVNVWIGDGVLMDDVAEKSDLEGIEFWYSVEEFKAGLKPLSIDNVWPSEDE